MNSPFFGMLFGTLAGMFLGAIFVAAVCSSLERWAGVQFVKEPLLLIGAVGMPVGGIAGGLVGRWSTTTSHTG